MTIVTITYDAKCKDCRFLKEKYKGKRKLHYCSNKKSKYFNQQKTLRDLVCENWEL